MNPFSAASSLFRKGSPDRLITKAGISTAAFSTATYFYVKSGSSSGFSPARLCFGTSAPLFVLSPLSIFREVATTGAGLSATSRCFFTTTAGFASTPLRIVKKFVRSEVVFFFLREATTATASCLKVLNAEAGSSLLRKAIDGSILSKLGRERRLSSLPRKATLTNVVYAPAALRFRSLSLGFLLPFAMAACCSPFGMIVFTSHRSLVHSSLLPSAARCVKTAPSAARSMKSARDSWEKKSTRLFCQVAAAPSVGTEVRALRPVLALAAANAQVGDLTISREDVVKEDDPTNNVPDSVFSKLGLQLHNRGNHPLGILKNEIYSYFDERFQGVFKKFDNLSPIVSVKANFDDVLVPPDHVSRRYNDTYYVNSETVLRCHTSAHQAEKLREGQTHFLVAGDVYRRDAIDATHYPVFHQMEGFRVFEQSEWESVGPDGTAFAAKDLKETLEGLAERLFGKVEMRWLDTYFPFTDPSFELEIYYQDKWMEVLGCGVVEQEILDNNGRSGTKAWAFGLGLERLAMVLFGIPDIRLFWSDDTRFTSQFSAGILRSKFKSFSKFPPCYKDMSFWISDTFSENNLCEVVRGVAGDLVEEVVLIDEFTSAKKGKTSHCYRITYRSMERSLTDDEINKYQMMVREEVESKLKVSLR